MNALQNWLVIMSEEKLRKDFESSKIKQLEKFKLHYKPVEQISLLVIRWSCRLFGVHLIFDQFNGFWGDDSHLKQSCTRPRHKPIEAKLIRKNGHICCVMNCCMGILETVKLKMIVTHVFVSFRHNSGETFRRLFNFGIETEFRSR